MPFSEASSANCGLVGEEFDPVRSLLPNLVQMTVAVVLVRRWQGIKVKC